MKLKALYTALILVLFFTALSSIPLVGSLGLPNPDHIFYATTDMPETVDPAWAYDKASRELIQNIYEPLCAFNGNSTEEFVAMLADDWPGYDENPTSHEIIPSDPDPAAPAGTNQTWYFHLRSGVKFHDNTDLETADVEYSFERGMLMDHSGGPMWMLYEPLLGVMGSSEYDFDGDEVINETEYNLLENGIKGAIESNDTWVWFNLVVPYAPFQQILSQTWGMILSKDYAIAHGCWNGQYNNYTEFLRCYDPPSPGPLMIPVPETLGTGPYVLVGWNTDPDTGNYTLESWTGYWRTPAPTKWVTVRCVMEWTNRKIQFFETVPAKQADFVTVPRVNSPEISYGCFNSYSTPIAAIGAMFFNYNVSQSSDYTPKLGTTSKPDLFSDRNMRLAFIYSLNITKHLLGFWLGGAVQPTTCMPPGTAYYNSSKQTRDINLTLAQQTLNAAWDGQAWEQGITVKLVYSIGDTAGKNISKMIEDFMEHQLTWGGSAVVDIQPTGVTRPYFESQMNAGNLCIFITDRIADFPDPHNWFTTLMHSHGDYSGYGQNVIYGLGDISASWPTINVSYGPPPYTNDFGETVTAINNTYVESLIERALALPSENRSKVYHELMDIYFAEASQQPIYASYNLHFERSWMHGWINTWNANPIGPGYYFYTITKSILGPVIEVDVAVVDIAMSPTNNITQYLLDGDWHNSGNPAVKPVPYIKLNYTSKASVPLVPITAYVKYHNATGPDIIVLCMWVGITPKGHAHEFGTAVALVSAGESVAFGPKTVSLTMPAVGDYEVYVYCFMPSSNVFNVNVTKDFDARWFNATGFCDISADLVVDGQDFQLVKRSVGYSQGGDRWRWMADVNADEIVDGQDLQLVKNRVGRVVYTKS